MRTSPSTRPLCATPLALLLNTALVYLAYAACRVLFVAANWDALRGTLFLNSWRDLLSGSLLFDTSAILYTNALYALLMLLPLHRKESRGWQRAARWLWALTNGACVAVNLCDAVYVQYTGRRTTATVFSEFAREDNLPRVALAEAMRHWWLLLCAALLLWAMWRAYRRPAGHPAPLATGAERLRYYGLHTALLCLCATLMVGGMRGGFATAVRPVTISNAKQFVNRPLEAAVVLNTPFSLIRTLGKKPFTAPGYFSPAELDRRYSPVHAPSARPARRRNVVVLIVESFGREYIGAYNERLEGGRYRGYTPFVDSLYRESMSFDYTFCNGRKSIDAMPSVLSGIPMFVEPFFLTPASLNDVSGLAGELGRDGYSSAFFHGAQDGSMGFQAFARATGFQRYYGREEFDADPRFRGERDFDGTWAIWDEPFLQYYALKMSEMREPFVTAVFTASSHHPYAVPPEQAARYPEEGGNPIHKCVRYTDHALGRFFRTARRQPWFKRTLFVLTSDHTNLSDHDEYRTDLGGFGSPILFYDPSGELFPAGRRHTVAQHTDILPTLLGALGYRRPHVAFGKDLLLTPDSAAWAVNYNNGVYQYVRGGKLLQFDGERVTGLYDIGRDWMLTRDLSRALPAERDTLERELKAVVQSYMERMNGDRLVVKEP